MPQAEARWKRITAGAGGHAVAKPRTARLRAIGAVLEKAAILIAMALLTYALIAVDTRAATPSDLSRNEGHAPQWIRCGILCSSWIDWA